MQLFLFSFLLLTHMQVPGVLLIGDSDATECGRVIDNEKEAKECLNLTSFDTRVPLPVILNQSLRGITKEDHNFLCANELPVYSFSCTLYSNDLIWYFNNETVGGFLPNDSVGHRFTGSFPTSAPVYDVTAVLTQVVPVNEYNVPYCVSILIIQPFDISQLQAMPFTVACQGHCTDDDEVCQVKSYKVAGTPAAPNAFAGSIQNISDVTGIQTGAKAIVSLNLSQPKNPDEMPIDYYELTLVGTHTNNTLKLSIDLPLQRVSYTQDLVVSEGNYAIASITAVGLCGQRSAPSELILTNITVSNVPTSDTQQSQVTCTAVEVGLGVTLGVTVVGIIIMITLIIILALCVRSHRKSVTSSRQASPVEFSPLSEEIHAHKDTIQ